MADNGTGSGLWTLIVVVATFVLTGIGTYIGTYINHWFQQKRDVLATDRTNRLKAFSRLLGLKFELLTYEAYRLEACVFGEYYRQASECINLTVPDEYRQLSIEWGEKHRNYARRSVRLHGELLEILGMILACFPPREGLRSAIQVVYSAKPIHPELQRIKPDMDHAVLRSLSVQSQQMVKEQLGNPLEAVVREAQLSLDELEIELRRGNTVVTCVRSFMKKLRYLWSKGYRWGWQWLTRNGQNRRMEQ